MNIERIMERKKDGSIGEFDDLRAKDLSGFDLSTVSQDVLLKTNFDSKTVWPSSEKLPADFDPEKVVERSKNPGLDLKNMHEKGITGSGIKVSIIDQKLITDHVEYKDRIVNYHEIGEQDYEPQMHGSAVASILVGKDCGVAPQADLSYEAVPCGRDLNFFAQALNKIIEDNTENNKTRVVSCSIGYNEENDEPGLDAWKKALEDADKNGIIVVHCSMPDISMIGCGSTTDKDDPETYDNWLFGENCEEIDEQSVALPSDYKTYASCSGEEDYEYCAKGGISWSTPYLAGVIALMLQVNSSLIKNEVFQIIKQSVNLNEKGVRIINPQECVESAVKLKSE